MKLTHFSVQEEGMQNDYSLTWMIRIIHAETEIYCELI